MELMNAVIQRRSCRNYLSKPVPKEVLSEILEAGRYTPSGGNGQNWFCGVVTDERMKEELARAAGEQMWIATAPVVLALGATLDPDFRDLPEDDFGLIVNHARFGKEFIEYLNDYPDRRGVGKFWINANPLIPGEHIFLAAVNHGLRACWVGYLDVDRAGEILALPEDKICLFLMPIGYPVEEPKEIKRKSLDELVFFEKWGK